MRNRSPRIVKTFVSILGLMAALLLTVTPAHSNAFYSGPATASEQGGDYSGTCTGGNGRISCTLQLVSGTPVSANMKTTATIYVQLWTGVLPNCNATIFKNGTLSATYTY
jgi:hypothetical protein